MVTVVMAIEKKKSTAASAFVGPSMTTALSTLDNVCNFVIHTNRGLT